MEAAGRILGMRNLHLLDLHRITDPLLLKMWGGWAGDETCGAFMFPSDVDKAPLRVIASSGEGWDHVSISRANRCPNWQEMKQIAALFFKEDEVAMQLHVPASEHVNNHPYCLHWWRPIGTPIPLPPAIFVGYRDLGVILGDPKKQEEALRRVRK
jgi:hypothetical protein